MNTEHSSTHFDVIVIGGGHEGQSAALQLARARRRVLVMGAGQRRNRFSPVSHGLIGLDGHSPGAVAANGRAQLLAYPNLQWRDDTVIHAERANTDFVVRDESGRPFSAQPGARVRRGGRNIRSRRRSGTLGPQRVLLPLLPWLRTGPGPHRRAGK
jgi:choline dehydrogenase-like flavoprotein